MELTFDFHGNLPPEKIELNWTEIEENFVSKFGESKSRKKLYVNFERFLKRFKTEITEDFFVWVNGSFVSQKLNPKDIDAVFFVNYKTCQLKKSVLDRFWFNKKL